MHVAPPVAHNGPTAPDTTVAVPIWPKGTSINVNVLIATTANPGEVLSLNPAPGTNLAHLHWDNIKYGDWDIDRTWSAGIRLPPVG